MAQLSLEMKYLTYYLPKTQLLKWIGNKQKFATEITRFFPTSYHTYFELFLGSGSIMATFAPKNGHCSDAFKPLMEIWMKLKEAPKGLIDWYAERRTRVSEKNKIEIYEDIKAFEKRVQEWHARTKYIQFSIMDYQEAFDLAKEGDHLL